MKKIICLLFASVSLLVAHSQSAEDKLKEKGIVLPAPQKPVANYVNAVRVGNLLFLAGKGLHEMPLIKFASDAYFSNFFETEKERKLLDSSFCLGKAGFLSTAYLMTYEANKQKEMLAKINQLENQIKMEYHPDLPFGFEVKCYESNMNDKLICDPSLLNGSAGIALSLLLVQQRMDPIFTRIFLLA